MSNAGLLEAIREEALPGIWSKGVTLSRSDAVTLQNKSDKEVELRVRVGGRPVPFTVVLYPQDDAWECDCPSKVDPCEHAVAGAIALQQSDKQAAPLQAAEQRWTRLLYRFSRESTGLSLMRVLVPPEGEPVPLEGSLAQLLSRPADASRLQVEQADLQADRLLDRPTRVALPAERLNALLQILKDARNVTLDGRTVAVADDVLMPRATVEDRNEAVTLTLSRDPSITAVVSPGIALCADTLVRLGETQATGLWLEHLPLVRTFAPNQWGELASKILPDLSRRMQVNVVTRRIPKIDRTLRPRVVLDVTQVDAGLSIFPTLVYGSPPAVRIDAGNMVFLQGAVPLRDERSEQQLLTQLRDELGLLPGRRTRVDKPDMATWADKLRRWRGDLTGDAASFVSPSIRLKPKLSLQSALTDTGIPHVGFTLDFEVEGGGPGSVASVDAASVVRAWSEGLGLVPLHGGGWAQLPRTWLEKHGQKLVELLAARQDNGIVANHALPTLGALCEALEQPPPPGLEKLAALAQGFDALPAPVLPPDVSVTLRPYQLQGVAWLSFLRSVGLGGILADDMGLGKTLQTICVLGRRTLVVAPTSVLPNWKSELARFRPNLKVCVYHGANRSLDESADVTLTTYALMRLDASVLGAQTWDTLVMDEAQAIKNPDSQVARAAYAMKANFRVALSGTPLENRLEELWSLMHFANPGLLGGRSDFNRQFSQPIADGNTAAGQTLRRRIRPFLLRRLKREVAANLPPRTESVRHVALDERERAIYDTVLAATRAEVLALMNDGSKTLKALEALLRLRQAACHSALVPGQQALSSSKVESLVEALTTATEEGHKALVFSQWTSLLDLIEPALQSAGLPFVRLDGSTANRGEITERFQSPEGPTVMLISLKAGGTGLNLTAADHVFLMDPWWNPAVEAQAADRAHRIGQDKPVFVYRLVAQGTVEERILSLQDKKRALFDAALHESAAAVSLTRNDLLELLA